MTSFFSSQKKNQRSTIKKIAIFLVVFLIIFSIVANYSQPAQAQMPISVTSDVPATTKTVLEKIWDKLKTLLKKAGSIAMQKTVSSALNKIAYDTANYIGSGGEGQKPLFTKEYIGDYLTQIGDEAAGQFVESFAGSLSQGIMDETGVTAAKEECAQKYRDCSIQCQDNVAPEQQPDCLKACNSDLSVCNGEVYNVNSSGKVGNVAGTLALGMADSFNVCQPTSLESKVKITLGLVDQQRPQGPSCKASEIINNWEEAVDLSNEDFMDKFKDIFDPRGNELGIYWTAKTDLGGQVQAQVEYKQSEYETGGGWLDVRDIAGKIKGTPGEAEKSAEDAKDIKQSQFGKVTGDILVDAANTFLNQLAISAFNNLMQSLGSKTSKPTDSGTSANVLSYEGDPNVVFGESTIKEITRELLEPNFGERADYNILSSLAICPDPQNPGPTNCVIDSGFMQAVTEKKTVAEAIQEGYLQGGWQFTKDTQNSSYSARNISILRKYRILPVGWEVAVQKAYASSTVKKVTLMDLVSCFDKNDSYNQFSSNFDVRDQAWCQGLVDPNWVLKAPLNYCKKEGASAQILSKMVAPGQKGQGDTPDLLSEIKITRADDYCADEQTCIKEKKDGSCEAYGYCNEEKRIWNFSEDSCEPIYNTCQTFANVNSGQTASYLENTLNYGSCNAENAGCRQYSLFGAYATSTGTVSWNINQSLYLNKNTENCDSKDEGCTELMRVKSTWGSNLVMNADFSNDSLNASSTAGSLLNNYWPYWSSSNTSSATRKASIVNSAQEPGGSIGKALKLEVSRSAPGQIVIGTYSNNTYSLVPDNLEVIPGKAYTLSADIYLAQGHKVTIFIGEAADGVLSDTDEKNKWIHLSVTRALNDSFSELSFGINGDSMDYSGDQVVFYIKNIKFEMSDWDTGFSVYGSFKTYEKLIPPYLEKACYFDATSASKDYRLRGDASSACYDYARKCNKDEVDCELYTDSQDDFAVPAKVTSADYCPKECVGYDVYVTQETHFNSPQAENLLPSQAKTCDIEAVGCNEFTNLDELAQGGESTEYYTYLKQCIKPDQNLCSSFYSWEGTETGYQLKAYSLKKDNIGGPAVTADDSTLCNATIYNVPLSDPDFNPDCREFYNAGGQVFYHLLSRTITCSENCHAYRLTEKNFDKTLTQVQCTGTDKHWDANSNVCYVCLNGGLWDTNHQACVYQAIPKEGKTCNAAQNGCREYNGNDGNNVQLLGFYNYENGLEGWYSNCPNGIQISTVSNNRNGHSVLYNNGANQCQAVGETGIAAVAHRSRIIEQLIAADNIAAQLKLGGLVTEGQAYSVKFLARANSNTTLNIYFYNKDTGKKAYFNADNPVVVKGGNEWAIYQANLENLDHKVGENEMLIMTGSANFYFDDFILSEITDRYYLIKNSSDIPDICYYDTFDNYRGADYNLGCSRYTDRDNLTHYLRQFSKICANESVGCEQMIDTKNYTPYQSGIWQDTNANGVCDSDEPDCVTVPGDSALYAIYDSAKQCNSADLGCSLMGQGQGSDVNITWSDVFKKNNPNNYQKTLCGQAEVGCEEWRTNDGSFSYFKDPGINVCSYRASQDPTIADKAWYKVPVKRCDYDDNGKIDGTEMNREVCANEASCGGKPCIIDNNDYPCSVSYFKTIGWGGAGNQIPTPDQQAGLCDTKNSGCTEYIDPVSQFSPNLIFNPYLSANRDGWQVSGSNAQQVVKSMEYNKLYILETEGAGNITLNFTNNVKPLLMDNTFGTSTKTLTLSNSTNQPIIFNSLSNNQVTVQANTSLDVIQIREAIVDYQLKDKIDKKSCNGLIKFNNGCVLFNERTINGGQGLINLETGWDAYASQDGTAPTLCDSSQIGSCTANQLIKVRPDRVCAKWLDCITYIEDPETKQRVCYAVGECNRLNDKNGCANFITSSSGALTFDPLKTQNASGYSLINKYALDQMTEVGLNSEAHYGFEDSVPALSCKRTINFTPLPGSTTCNFDHNINKDSLVREPEGAPTDYPASGKTYLKVPATYQISPMAENGYIVLNYPSATSNPNYNTYFLTYLLNTKNSGLGAKIVLTDPQGTILKDAADTSKSLIFSDSANDGWERKIIKFNVNATNNKVVIYLTSDTTNPKEDGYVYFDDINIEPVLKIADDNYVTRECRLYPSSEDLTCFSNNNNVISSGLEGYCLEHDKNNPNVCLLWYPVDRISPTRDNNSVLGYQGKFPLNYCTELNGNFDLVEKRLAKHGYYNSYSDDGRGFDCYYESTALGNYCVNNAPADFQGYSHDWNWNTATTLQTYCGTPTGYFAVHAFGWDGDYWLCLPNNYGNNTTLVADPQASISFKMPGMPDSIKLPVFSNGWYPYDGLLIRNGVSSCKNIPCTYYINETDNADPPVRVYNYDNPAINESNLKLIASSDQDELFKITCNRFIQTVNSSGGNKAWTNRISKISIYATQTPKFFIKDNGYFYGPYGASTYKIDRYGRNREDTPFGSAIWPTNFDLLSSEKITFKNQYSKKNNEEVFAGRPYGCEGTSCDNIGYCSLDPNIFCLLGNATSSDFVSKQTCSANGYGICVPLWQQSLSYDFNDYQNILRTIFLKSYNSFSFATTSQSYVSDDTNYDFIKKIPSSFKQNCPNNVRTGEGIDSFCAVWPEVSNVKAYYGNTNNRALISSGNNLIITTRGVYRLEFNSKVDSEQQPLKEIVINWGDGTKQVITGQDHRPSASNPHVFYHYYSQPGTKILNITIYDNWGFFGSCFSGVCTLPPHGID